MLHRALKIDEERLYVIYFKAITICDRIEQ